MLLQLPFSQIQMQKQIETKEEVESGKLSELWQIFAEPNQLSPQHKETNLRSIFNHTSFNIVEKQD